MTDPRAVVQAALSEVTDAPLVTDEEGDQTFVVDGVPAFIQHGRLGADVNLLTLTCLAASGQPLSPALDRWVHERNAAMLLGGIVLLTGPEATADVLVRYCLPSDSLDAARLRSVLLPVIAAASDVRRELVAWQAERI
ncbi:MAG: hypothetical protein H0V64_12525 [Geodermatophilaceae bacterium]|nr:hypothetical protein [Geodermatophilaceae bacterium]